MLFLYYVKNRRYTCFSCSATLLFSNVVREKDKVLRNLKKNMALNSA